MKIPSKPRMPNGSFSLLWRYAKRHRARIARLTLVYFAATALFILAPQTLSRFIDGVQAGDAGGGWSATALAIALYLAAVLARTLLSCALSVQLLSVGQHITDDHRRDVMEHYLSLDMQRLSGSTSGEIITRLDEDVQGLFQYYYVLFFKLAGSAVALFAILAALVSRSGWLCAALFAVSALAIVGFKILQDRGTHKYVRSSAARAAFGGTVKELLDNAVTLRALGAERFATGRLKAAVGERYRENFPASLVYGQLWSASTIMQCAVQALGLLFALLLWDAGAITVGVAYMIFTYSDMIIEPLQDFRNHMGDMQGARAGILRTRALLDTPGMASGGTRALPDGALALDIDALRFAYEGQADVLRGVTLSVRPGVHLGIMGETGCGKSTLAGLLAGLNGYDRGSIRLGGAELREVSPASLRERVAYCTQRVQLIHGTLRDNIALFDSRYTDADILEAARGLELTDWLGKFREGLDTRLDMGEGSLSSGEAQLITLIRLALRGPGLVLLDEITAHLDAATEKRVTRAVAALCRGRTVIAIAHKREALGWMDGIMRMEGGVLTARPEEVAL